MAVDKLVDSQQLNSDLTSIANAIRTRGGTSESLAFPSGFVTAIGNIPSGSNPSLQRAILRTDAVLDKSWTYDKRIVADEELTIPEYSTTQHTFIASGTLEELSINPQNYKYYVIEKALAIPEYSHNDSGRGRFEWSMSHSCYELNWEPMSNYHALSTDTIAATNAAVFTGAARYVGVYWYSQSTVTLYTSTSYGIWISLVAPSYASGVYKISSPNIIIRGQPNILDQPFWEALTDIRYQYKIELWKVPVGSLNYDGWQFAQTSESILDCVYSPTHTLV